MERPKTVLFVDDDENILHSLRRAFLDEPIEMLFTTSGQEALELMQQQEVDIVVSDMKMPGMGGQELLNTVRERYPQAIRILFSGQPTVRQEEVSSLVRAINQGDIFKFIGKTFNMNTDVKHAIREATGVA
ncbi:MAG: response regulator [Planctomycetes bacterium]|nr:response regulator [Planctomycetota bacterium]